MFVRSATLRQQSRTALHLLNRRYVHCAPRIVRVVSPQQATSSRPIISQLPSLRHAFSSSCARLEQQQEDGTQSQPIGKVEPKLSLTFTCTVPDCGHRSTHEFTRRSYERGIVLVQCPGCQNRHLIADHLSWFTENASDPKTIEQIIEANGGKVKRGVNYVDGKGYETMEIFEDTDERKES